MWKVHTINKKQRTIQWNTPTHTNRIQSVEHVYVISLYSHCWYTLKQIKTTLCKSNTWLRCVQDHEDRKCFACSSVWFGTRICRHFKFRCDYTINQKVWQINVCMYVCMYSLLIVQKDKKMNCEHLSCNKQYNTNVEWERLMMVSSLVVVLAVIKMMMMNDGVEDR